MLLIDESNAERYLRDAGRIAAGEIVEITRLSGGVSNEVLYVAFPCERSRDFVLKQAREQLRVADPWFCGVDRIWREVEVLRICERVLAAERPDAAHGPPLARTPRILFEDRENYCFGMEAAPREHTVWKRQLLAEGVARSEHGCEGRGDRGEKAVRAVSPISAASTPIASMLWACHPTRVEQDNRYIAQQCGRLLGTLHAGTWEDRKVAAALDDRRIFDELRLDPYYRTVATRYPDAAPLLNRLVDSVWSRRLCLVHADFSPKNLLVYPGGLMMVDFETGHYGDPAFDLGFFLTHLMLKAFYHAPRHEPLLDRHEPLLELTERFCAAYRETMAANVGHVSYVPESYVPEGDRGHVGNVPHALAHLERHAVLNFAGCAWARLDGKSPVEYLTDVARRDQVRALCRWTLEQAPPRWDDVLAKCRSILD